MLKEEHRQLLVAAAEKIGTELSPDSVEKFSRYGELLLEWNKVMNLTAVTDEREMSLNITSTVSRFSPILTACIAERWRISDQEPVFRESPLKFCVRSLISSCLIRLENV